MELEDVHARKEFWEWINANKPKPLTMKEKLLKEMERQGNPMTSVRRMAWLAEQKEKRNA
jgi:hypothetical protein